MPVKIAISGTPGCGKSTFAKSLAKHLSCEYIELTAFVKEHNLADEFDEVDQSLVVDIPKLNEVLNTVLNEDNDYIIDGHFAHDIKGIEGCIVCTCDLSQLNKRLVARNYSKEKIRENLDAEIFQVCFTESQEAGLPTITLNCTKPLSQRDIESVWDSLTQIMKQ